MDTVPETTKQETAVSLKEYIERIFDEREKALQIAFKSQQEALSIATIALNRELEHLNNLREEINSARREFLTRVEYSSSRTTIEEKISAMEKIMDMKAGSVSGMSILWNTAVSLATAAAATTVILNFIRH